MAASSRARAHKRPVSLSIRSKAFRRADKRPDSLSVPRHDAGTKALPEVSRPARGVFAENARVQASLRAALDSEGEVVVTTWYNGGEGFKVTVTKSRRDDGLLVANIQVMDYSDHKHVQVSIRIDDVVAVGFGCGENEDISDKFVGNAVAIVRSDNHVLVAGGQHLVQYPLVSADEKVYRFVSTLGNNGVPYGWVQTSRGVYVTNNINCAQGYLADPGPGWYLCVQAKSPQLRPLRAVTVATVLG